MGKRFKTELTERNGIVGKECSKCREWKGLEEFNNHKRGLGGRSSCCKKCRKEWYKEWYSENKEHESERFKTWRHACKEYEKERQNKWYQENKEDKKEYRKQWNQENKELIQRTRQKRRARKNSLPDTWTPEQLKQVMEFFGGCALTGATDSIDFDHVIPIATGHGGTVAENMIPLRADLNGSKRHKNIFEWFEENKDRFELSQDKFDTLIEYLADLNQMTIEEYKDYVYWCHENPVELSPIAK